MKTFFVLLIAFFSMSASAAQLITAGEEIVSYRCEDKSNRQMISLSMHAGMDFLYVSGRPLPVVFTTQLVPRRGQEIVSLPVTYKGSLVVEDDSLEFTSISREGKLTVNIFTEDLDQVSLVYSQNGRKQVFELDCSK